MVPRAFPWRGAMKPERGAVARLPEGRAALRLLPPIAPAGYGGRTADPAGSGWRRVGPNQPSASAISRPTARREQSRRGSPAAGTAARQAA